MTLEQIEQIRNVCYFMKSIGASSKHSLPIFTILELCSDAEAYLAMPEQIKEAAKLLRDVQ